ncbi:MAG: helix-turn-helix transcriptional regulator [Bacillota bacterium]
MENEREELTDFPEEEIEHEREDLIDAAINTEAVNEDGLDLNDRYLSKNQQQGLLRQENVTQRQLSQILNNERLVFVNNIVLKIAGYLDVTVDYFMVQLMITQTEAMATAKINEGPPDLKYQHLSGHLMKDLLKHWDISQSQLRQVINTDRLIFAKYLVSEIADYLGVAIDYLVARTITAESPISSGDRHLNEERPGSTMDSVIAQSQLRQTLNTERATFAKYLVATIAEYLGVTFDYFVAEIMITPPEVMAAVKVNEAPPGLKYSYLSGHLLRGLLKHWHISRSQLRQVINTDRSIFAKYLIVKIADYLGVSVDCFVARAITADFATLGSDQPGGEDLPGKREATEEENEASKGQHLSEKPPDKVIPVDYFLETDAEENADAGDAAASDCTLPDELRPNNEEAKDSKQTKGAAVRPFVKEGHNYKALTKEQSKLAAEHLMLVPFTLYNFIPALVNEDTLRLGYLGLCKAVMEKGPTDKYEFVNLAVNQILRQVRNNKKMNGAASTPSGTANIRQAVPDHVSMKETALLCYNWSMVKLPEAEREFFNQAIQGLPVTQIENWEKLCRKNASQKTGEHIIISVGQKWKELNKAKDLEANSYRQYIDEYLIGVHREEVNRTKDLNKNFCGRYIDKYLDEKGLIQSEFALILGVPRENIRRYQQGTFFPSPDIQEKIADLLGVSVNCFLNKPPEAKFWDSGKEVVAACFEELLNNMDREELARIFGINEMMVTCYVQKSRRPEREMMAKLAGYLGVAEKDFLKLSVEEASRIAQASYSAANFQQQSKAQLSSAPKNRPSKEALNSYKQDLMGKFLSFPD